MAWFKNIFHRNDASQNDDEALRQELERLGVDLDVPGLVRSTSSNTSLDSSSSDSLCALDKHTQCPLHSIDKATKFNSVDNETSLLEVLQGVNRAVEAHCQADAKDVPGDESGNVYDFPVSDSWAKAPDSPPSVPRRRIVCPNFIETETQKDVKKDLSKLIFRSPTMQTYPKSSVRVSRFSFEPRQGELSDSRSKGVSDEIKSVSFSPKVHVLEYERECVHHSTPGWWNFFS